MTSLSRKLLPSTSALAAFDSVARLAVFRWRQTSFP